MSLVLKLSDVHMRELEIRSGIPRDDAIPENRAHCPLSETFDT